MLHYTEQNKKKVKLLKTLRCCVEYLGGYGYTLNRHVSTRLGEMADTYIF